MIVDSLNVGVYVSHRGWQLIGGIVLLAFFWGVCSLPTNTHTFFYRMNASKMINDDISATCGYLSDIKNNSKEKDQAKRKADELDTNIQTALKDLEAEIMNDNNPGDGPEARRIRQNIADLLGVATIDKISYRGTSRQERQRLCEQYRKKILQQTESVKERIQANILKPNQENLDEARTIYKNLGVVENGITEGTISLNSPDDMRKYVCHWLNKGYSSIKKNKDFVNFQSEDDQTRYTADNPTTKVQSLISVVEVWKGYWRGEYKGLGFIYWVIIAVLIDVAGFVFFVLAFRKTDE